VLKHSSGVHFLIFAISCESPMLPVCPSFPGLLIMSIYLIYISDTPIPWITFLFSSGLNLTIDFWVLSVFLLHNYPQFISCIQSIDIFNPSSHTLPGLCMEYSICLHRETLNRQDCLSLAGRDSPDTILSIYFNTCVSWRFQRGYIILSNYT
jgi:hypothetical protein